MGPEFPMPQQFHGFPVIAGIYVPRADKYPFSLWVVVGEDLAGSEYYVGFLLPAGNSMQSWHYIRTRTDALDLMREESEFWRDLIK